MNDRQHDRPTFPRRSLMRRSLSVALPAAIGCLLAAPGTQAAAPSPEAIASNLLEATKQRSYEKFLADANDDFRSNISKQMFEGVANQLAPRLRQGYKTVYLSRLRQGDVLVHLWRLEFADGKDELLLRVAIERDTGKVAGAVVQ